MRNLAVGVANRLSGFIDRGQGVLSQFGHGICESIDNSGKLADGTNKSNNKGNESECGNDRRNSTERNLHNFLHIARTRPAGRVLDAN